MTWVWWLLGITGIIILAFVWPLGIGVVLGWRQGEALSWQLSLRLWGGLLPLKFRRVPAFIMDKTSSGLESVHKFSPEHLRRIPSLGTLQEMLTAARPLLHFAGRCLILRRLDFYLIYGSGDAALTGKATGYFWAIAPLVHSFILQYQSMQKVDFRYGLEPAFAEPEAGIDFRTNLTIFPLLVLILGIRSFLLFRKFKKMEAMP